MLGMGLVLPSNWQFVLLKGEADGSVRAQFCCRALSAFLHPEVLGSPELLVPVLCSRCVSCSFVAPWKG